MLGTGVIKLLIEHSILLGSENYCIIIFLTVLATDFPTLYEIRQQSEEGGKQHLLNVYYVPGADTGLLSPFYRWESRGLREVR